MDAIKNYIFETWVSWDVHLGDILEKIGSTLPTIFISIVARFYDEHSIYDYDHV